MQSVLAVNALKYFCQEVTLQNLFVTFHYSGHVSTSGSSELVNDTVGHHGFKVSTTNIGPSVLQTKNCMNLKQNDK